MNPKSSLNKNTLIITILLITSSFLINKVASMDIYDETLSPIYRDSSGVSSVFVINNTETIDGNFALYYHLENDTQVGYENKQINAGQLLAIDLSQSAPFANDPFTGYVIINADVAFTAEILPAPTPTPTSSPTPTPTPTSSPTPTPSPSPAPTSSPFYSPTPEPQQTEQEIVVGVVIVVAVFGAGLGLLLYLIRRK